MSNPLHLPRAACVLLKKGNQFLAVSRKDNVNDFGLPGGKVHPNESDLEAAKRELQEETGLIVSNLQLLFAGDDGLNYWTATYYAEYQDGEISTNETGIVKWLSREQLINNSSFGHYNQLVFDALDQL